MQIFTNHEIIAIFCQAMSEKMDQCQGDFNSGLEVFSSLDQLIHFLGGDDSNEADQILIWLDENRQKLRDCSSDHDFQKAWETWQEKLSAVKSGEFQKKPQSPLFEIVGYLLETEPSTEKKLEIFLGRISKISDERHNSSSAITIMDRLGSIVFACGSTDKDAAERILNFLNKDIRQYLEDHREVFWQYQGRNLNQEFAQKMERFRKHLSGIHKYKPDCHIESPSRLDDSLNFILRIMH